MPFPEAARVVYGESPLDHVICQLRFPPILKIDAELPATFQDEIRPDFPVLKESSGFGLELPAALSEQVPPEMLRQFLQPTGTRSFEFSSADGKWTVTLTRTFIALTTTSYRKWEDFKRRFKGPFDALVKAYNPSYFSRIGLRYTDVIRPSRLGLSRRPWRSLLNNDLIGMFASPKLAQSIDRFESIHELRLSEDVGRVRITTKLIKNIKEPDAFVIDSDFFDTSETHVEDAFGKLDAFNQRSTRFMRWAVRDPLHEAMAPVAV